MKSFITLCCLAFASILAAQSADEAAIMELCLKDTKAYVERDFAAWQSCWHQSEQSSILHTPGNIHLGWDSIYSAMKEDYEAATEPRSFTPSHSNFFFNIQGDRAYVTFEQAMASKFTMGGAPAFVNKTYEVRNLIKVDGKWKIFNQVTAPLQHEGRPQDDVENFLQVHGILMNAERTEEAVKIAALMADLYPEHPMGHWGMGYHAFAQQDKAGALKYLEKAMSMFDDAVPPGLQALYEQAQALE